MSDSMPLLRRRSIDRAELVRMVDAASEGCTESTREKLRVAVSSVDRVAVGWFHCEGAACPTRLARRPNQKFQEAFDRAMAVRYGFEWNDDKNSPYGVEPFVVEITDVG